MENIRISKITWGEESILDNSNCGKDVNVDVGEQIWFLEKYIEHVFSDMYLIVILYVYTINEFF